MKRESFTDIYHRKKQDEHTNQQGKVTTLYMGCADIFLYFVW
jgi:hypothetical protein